MVNLMIVEDNDIVRRGLVKFLSLEPDIRIAADVGSGLAAIAQIKTGTVVDVVLVDWNMPDMDGLQLTAQLAAGYPDVKVIILTMHGKQDYKDKARAAGAKGYLLKQGDFNELIIAIKEVATGKTVYG